MTKPQFKMRIKQSTILQAALLLLMQASYVAAQSPLTPPPQPSSGPGGSDYPFGSVNMKGPYHASGYALDNNFRYFTFEPADPTPIVAPVILFLHGFLANNPVQYLEWLQHMARKGYVVVWVQYDAASPPAAWLDNALTTFKDALNRLNTHWWEAHVIPQIGPDGQMETGYVGHSFGAYLSAILAETAAAGDAGIPRPKAVVAIEPGGLGVIPATTFADIDPQTILVVVVGDKDTVVCTATALFIWGDTAQISRRNFLVGISDPGSGPAHCPDCYGSPAQIMDHFFPNTTGFGTTAAIDDRDFNITWKLSVAAMNCALNNMDCQFALGNGGAEQVDMGNWSDEVPVTPLLFVQDPTSLTLPCNK